MWWERSAALSNLYISTGKMTVFNRRNLVEVRILFRYHRTLLSKLKALKAFSIREFTSASALQFFSTRHPPDMQRYPRLGHHLLQDGV